LQPLLHYILTLLNVPQVFDAWIYDTYMSGEKVVCFEDFSTMHFQSFAIHLVLTSASTPFINYPVYAALSFELVV